MKNFTIKKVALGLFLAGYATSSVFALAPVATINTIEGNAPVLNSHGPTPTVNTVTVDIFPSDGSTYVAGNPVHIGDKVRVSYRLTDADGDSDNVTAAKVKDSFQVFKKVGNAWTLVSVPVTPSYDPGDTELGTLEFEITSDFIGVSKIGFMIQPRTEFGLPAAGDTLYVGDIFGGGRPTVGGGGSNPGNAGGPGGGGNSSGGNIGGGSPGPGANPGVILPRSSHVGIFLIDSTGNISNRTSYTKSGTGLKPKYGERYAAIVWEDADGNEVFDASETDLSANFSFEWHVVGNGITENGNVVAETGALTGDGNRATTNDTIFLGSKNVASDKHNSMYSFRTHKAGIQGYQLQVIAN